MEEEEEEMGDEGLISAHMSVKCERRKRRRRNRKEHKQTGKAVCYNYSTLTT